MRSSPFPFTPVPTTLLAFTTYLIITTLLLVVHFVPPRNIPSQVVQDGLKISVTEAWHDLLHITRDWGYHPYNSRASDHVREYLARRIEEILKANRAASDGEPVEVEVISDMQSNTTFSLPFPGVSVYFEGTNLMVIVKGSDPEKDELGAVLVNAHYDSVSTGYGATDDGTGVVTILQLISHFTNPNTPPEHRPKRDVMFLLNNGEEDYLNGARAFAVSPWGSAPKIFYNIEGAGAGGRAILFRSTDTEVTQFYKRVSRPFGTSVGADGFKKGFIRSQTDYKVFTEDLGMRGLDVAFWKPRSMYHTEDDDIKHTSRESLWHMLGGAIQAVNGMALDTRKEFNQPFEVGGTNGVWFDMFGRSFVLLRLHTLFAVGITMLTVSPLIILLTIYLLARSNKLYMFSGGTLNGKSVHSWKGFFVYPIAFLFATSAVIGTAYLLVKVNPMIVYGHLYVVWTCFLSEWFLVAWIVGKVGQWWRGSALTRGYTFGWMWLGWWAAFVYVAHLADKADVSGGYFVMFYYAGVFLCFWLSLLEQFALPAKDDHLPAGSYRSIASPAPEPSYTENHRAFPASSTSFDHSTMERGSSVGTPSVDDHLAPTETSPLLSRRGSAHSSNRGRRPWPSFRRFADPEEDSTQVEHDSDASDGEVAPTRRGVYKYEQRWSREMPTGWGTWILQWLLSVPVQIIVAGQIGLVLGDALGMTGADGNNILTIYLGLAFFSVLYLLPLSPFLHRITHHLAYVSIFLFLTSIIYSLTAFPFHPGARLKFYFQQSYDLDRGENQVILVGVEKYVRQIIENELPSASGQEVACTPDWAKSGLQRCTFHGLEPMAADGHRVSWLEHKARRTGDKQARIEVVGKGTRACKILFDKPITGLVVEGIRYQDGDDDGGKKPIDTTTSSTTTTATSTSAATETTTKTKTKTEDTTQTTTETKTTKAPKTTTEPEKFVVARSPYPGHYPHDPHTHNPSFPQQPPLHNVPRSSFLERPAVPEGGAREVRLWSRDWERGWRVDISWADAEGEESEDDGGMSGKVVCLWSDANEKGRIPAFDEVLEGAPLWAVVSKLTDGLVEGWRRFEV